MATLANKSVIIFGGSLGLGYAVAEASLKSDAATVIIVSSNEDRIQSAAKRLRDGRFGAGDIKGFAVDAKDEVAMKDFLKDVGEVDHIVWTAGDGFPVGFPNLELDAMKAMFDLRFWGPVIIAKHAKFRPGGSYTITTGTTIFKPQPTWSIGTAVMGAVDSFARGLAVDLAPIRVNTVCPGAVNTELMQRFPPDMREKFVSELASKLPVKRVGGPEELAEAYLFCMKCTYLTGQRIQVDGGLVLT